MLGELLRLVWTDFRATWLSWVAVAVTVLIAATGSAFSLAILMTGGDAATELGGTVLGFALVGISSAVASLTGMVVNERRRTYARWKLLGLPGAGVFVVVLLQVFLLSLGSAVLGVLLAIPLVPPAARYCAAQQVSIGTPHADGGVLILAAAICTAVAVLSVLGRVFAVARVKPLVALRAAVVPRARPGITATVLGAIFAIAVVAISTTEDLNEDGAVVGVQMMILLVIVPWAGWILPPILQWTRVLRFLGVAARTAADNTRVRSAFTCAQVVPWFLSAGAVVGLGSPMMLMMREDGGRMDNPGLLVVIMAPAILPPLVAGVASILVLAPRVRTDAVVILRAGGTPRDLFGVALWESLAVVLSAGLLTVLYTLPGMAMVNLVYRGELWPVGWWQEILWGPLALILATMWLVLTAVNMAVRRQAWPRLRRSGPLPLCPAG